MATEKTDDKALALGWVELSKGLHVTQSSKIIRKAINEIKKEHTFCNIIARGYESGKVTIIEATGDRLLLDMPPDWPEEMQPQPLRIVFQDRFKLWNQFVVTLLAVGEDSISTTLPSRYIRLQRRENYRVSMPRNSYVSFLHKGVGFNNFKIENISSNGGLVFISSLERKRFNEEPAELLPVGDQIEHITLTVPDGKKETHVEIGKGRIVRTARNERRDICFGIQFLPSKTEERTLMQFVRQREITLLRKGME